MEKKEEPTINELFDIIQNTTDQQLRLLVSKEIHRREENKSSFFNEEKGKANEKIKVLKYGQSNNTNNH